MRTWLVLLVLLATVGWWFSPLSPRVPDPPVVARAQTAMPTPTQRPDTSQATAGSADNPLCPPPRRVAPGAEPLQTAVPSRFPALSIEDAALTPLAGFSIDARVLSRRDYDFGREADYSPTDLALGWGRMREDAVLGRLDIEQRGRWYHYRWHDPSPPIPSREIARSSANMHIIPADANVAAALARVRADQRVRIDGWLVEVRGADGWTWRSSTTRDDQGGGACELIYTCSVTPL